MWWHVGVLHGLSHLLHIKPPNPFEVPRKGWNTTLHIIASVIICHKATTCLTIAIGLFKGNLISTYLKLTSNFQTVRITLRPWSWSLTTRKKGFWTICYKILSKTPSFLITRDFLSGWVGVCGGTHESPAEEVAIEGGGGIVNGVPAKKLITSWLRLCQRKSFKRKLKKWSPIILL